MHLIFASCISINLFFSFFRQLPWDPKIGAAAGEMDYFVRFLVMTLLKNLEQKKLRYTKDPDPVAEAKSHVFFISRKTAQEIGSFQTDFLP